MLSLLRQKKTMRSPFRFPFRVEYVYEALLAAVQVEVEFRHREFIMSEDLEFKLQKMAEWLTGDTQKFGMMLCGGYGNGKSTLMRAVQQLLNCLRIPNPNYGSYCGLRIVDAKYIALLPKENYKEFKKLANCEMLGIDDMGIEPREILDYGNIYTPMIDILTKRYEDQLFTMITTNFTPPEIRLRYGDRIADRMNEMMDKIVFVNSSYRSENK